MSDPDDSTLESLTDKVGDMFEDMPPIPEFEAHAGRYLAGLLCSLTVFVFSLHKLRELLRHRKLLALSMRRRKRN